MFINEYLMTRWKFAKFTVPKFYRDTFFPIWVIIFGFGIFGWIYFSNQDVASRWKTIGAFLTFCAVYRGVFFKWMHADKTYRVRRQAKFDEKDFTVRVMIKEDKIRQFINGQVLERVEWKHIVRFEEAKTYFKLIKDEYDEGIFLEKDSFTSGTADEFKAWMAEKHPEIPYAKVPPVFNR